MKKVLIIYHRVDYDGLFSALVARRFYLSGGDVVELLGYNYGDSLSRSVPELLASYDEVCMVDCSFNDVEIMKQLYYSRKVLLIDHHETCITLLKNNGLVDWPGIQRIGDGACRLTFEYFFPDYDVPEVIRRLSLYDVWNHDELDWNEEVLPVQYALRTEYGVSLDNLILNESYIFSDDAIKDLEDDGRFVLKYLKKTWKGWVKNFSFDVTVAGRFKGICMLTPQFGSMPFEMSLEEDDYEVYVCANKRKNQDGRYIYSLSLYSTDDKLGDFSLGEYVKSITKTGIGGGHKAACGMELTEEQFIHLITNYEI